MKVIGFAKLTTKGQVTIPKKVRGILHLEEGDYIIFLQEKEGLIHIAKEIEVATPKK